MKIFNFDISGIALNGQGTKQSALMSSLPEVNTPPDLHFWVSPIVLSWMSAPIHEVVGGRHIIVLFSKGIEKRAQETSSQTQLSHPRRSAVTAQLTSSQGFTLRWHLKFPSLRRGFRFVPGLARNTSAG
jgi:hypothetical protein